MSRALRVLLVGGEAAGLHVLRAVAGAGCLLVGLMTSEEESERRMREVAGRLGCPVWPAGWVKDPAFAGRVQAASVDLLLNVHSLHIIRPEVLAAPRIGSFNMHPGPLPDCAGLNAVSWALYSGKSRHAVTIHRMVPELDAGPITYQSGLDIEDRDTALTLSVKCVKAGVPLMSRLLQAAATDPGVIPAIDQDLSRRRYYGKAVPQGGRLLWTRSARDIVNFVRACDYLPFRSPWGHPTCGISGREISIAKATRTQERCTAAPGSAGEVVGRAVKVAAADEWVLIHRVLEAGRFMDAADRLRPGQQFDEQGGGAG